MDKHDPWQQMNNLNEVFHAPTRIAILLFLLKRNQAKFSSIQKALSITAGNLSSHLKKLDNEGYIEIQKIFVDDKPLTMIYLTAKGSTNIRAYANILVDALNSNSQQTDQNDKI